jgi:hypothetical protein
MHQFLRAIRVLDPFSVATIFRVLVRFFALLINELLVEWSRFNGAGNLT